MSKQPQIKTWTQLAEALGIAQNTLRAWRTQSGSPKTKSVADWQDWISENKSEGKGTGRVEVDGQIYTAEDIRNFKAKLTNEQARHAAAAADLKELEFKMKSESLIPESELKETLNKLLVPLRRNLDTLPRSVASMANPENPQIAELAIREFLDDRVYAEIERIMREENQ